MIFRILLINLFFSAMSAHATLNIRNISSILAYFQKIEHTALDNYKFDSSLSDEENKKVLDRIHINKKKVFTELKSMSLELNINYDETEWTDIIAIIGIHGFKIKPDYMVPYFFSVGNEIDTLLEKIDTLMTLFKPIGHMSLYNGSASNFCTYTLPTLDPYFNTLRHESLSESYIKYIDHLVKTEMISIMSMQKKNRINLCGKYMSFNRALWNYYHLIMMGHIKYCSMMYFKWAMDVRCANEPVEYDIRWLDLATETAQKIMSKTKKTLKNVDYYVHNCDPTASEQEYSELDIELKRMIQTVVIDESDRSTTQPCNHNCNLESISDKINQTVCLEFHDCQNIDYDIDICQLEEKPRGNRWFRDNRGNVYGHSKTCENLKLLTGNSKWSEESCGFCLCTCVIRPSKSPYVITAISFREQVSNIKKNRVISSIQFTEQNYMIQVQIIEGELLPGNQIVNERLQQLYNFDYDQLTGQYQLVNRNGTRTPLSLGVDYGHPEVMNLDDVIAPPGHVVTGVRFRFAEDLLEKPLLKSGPIQLQIRVTPFDFVQGNLIDLDKTHWIAPSSSIQRTELILESPNRPTRCPKNDPDSTPNQFVKFRASDLRKDAGQSTVPFFDGQILSFYETSPFGGLGIYHRGSKGCGGYLAFRIFDIKLSKFLAKKFQ